uniref:Uncharacterized protein n=1 Tax=Psilocybe cubensis TaxID=181762 RepID=A0A8H7XTL2_PSICU
MQKTYIRTASKEDFDQICRLGTRCLTEDPLLAYFGCTTTVGGVIDLLCTKSKETGEEEFAAVSVWLPPQKRLALWNVFVLLFSGIIALGECIGTQGLWRLLWEFPAVVNESWRAACYSLDDPASWSLCQTWYLKIAFTAPEHRNQGNMTSLVHHRLANGSGVSFTLDVPSKKLEQYFSQMNFEIMNRCRLGAGYVDEFGNPEQGGRGIEIVNMVKHH